MAELEYAILAEYARIEPGTGLLTLAGGSFDRITVLTLPGVHQAGLALRVLLDADEEGADVEVSLETPDEEYLLRVKGRATQPESADAVAGRVGVSSVVPLVLSLPSVGVYQVHVIVNSQEARTIPFEVVKSDNTSHESV